MHEDARQDGRVAEGLEGIVVTKTRTSHVDGTGGRLVVAGRDIEALAREATFEEAVCALWSTVGLPVEGREALRAEVAEGRAQAFPLFVSDASEVPRDAMDALRAGLARLPEAFTVRPAWLVGAVGALAALHARRVSGQEPIAPRRGADHATDLLSMAGLPDDAASAKALGAYLVTVMDHGLNASTFAARVVASTGSDLVSAVVAGVGALKGPLHGGAPGPVLDMLDAIGVPERALAWLTGELEAKRRIMGMGHRIYRVRDPRAAVLEEALAVLEEARGDQRAVGRLALARAVEKVAKSALGARYPDRPLAANVEFYTAVLLDALGLPRTEFSAIFAAGRVAGWCAHVAEQRKTGRLLRPDSTYIGAWPSELGQEA